MSHWLDPTGRSTYGIGVCGRCNQKFSLEELHPDPNSPGLFVCLDDMDEFDPYRLPARQTEDIALRFARPDVPLSGAAADQGRLLLIGESPWLVLVTESGAGLLAVGVL